MTTGESVTRTELAPRDREVEHTAEQPQRGARDYQVLVTHGPRLLGARSYGGEATDCGVRARSADGAQFDRGRVRGRGP